jgi:ADP-ribose pyrophosphatase
LIRVTELIVDSDERVGEGGFLAIRRLRLRNRRGDGSTSAPYLSDAIVRPFGQDAVVVAIFARTSRGVEVLVRDGLRPTIALHRDPSIAPLPEPAPGLACTELVAGILEVADRGLAARAAAEVHEEAGFVVAAAHVIVLGAGALASPGCLAEKNYFTAVEVDPAAQQPPAGDGSPMEEGATTRWLPLDAAIAACVRGDITDLKTELCLRRLRDHLG